MSLKMKKYSQLRFDPISKDWVIIASNRSGRPKSFKKNGRESLFKKIFPQKYCPFCNLKEQEKPVLIYPKGNPGKWSLAVIPNKYPALFPYGDLTEKKRGPYRYLKGVGFHEVVVTRSHRKDFSQLPIDKIIEVFSAYQERYLELKEEKVVNYIFIFHNHGNKAGATISHPHSQIVGIPVIDSDVRNYLLGSEKYWREKKKCIHCSIINWEKKEKERIVWENDKFIAFCPFAYRMPFTVRIYPKSHLSYFEEIKDKKSLAEIFSQVLTKMRRGLKKPDYNFFLRTSPSDGGDYSYYHWHFEIIPRISHQIGGLDLGAGIEIPTIKPKEAALHLRKL